MRGRLPGPLRASVETALARLGLGTRIVTHEPVGGGCIHNGARIRTDTGATCFLKWNDAPTPGMFEAEAEGLRALRERCDLRIPAPYSWGEDGAAAWLLMEFVAPGAPSSVSGQELGEGLARMHQAGAASTFGWRRDNWIGSLRQKNPETASWGVFWRDARLRPQLELARERGRLQDERFDRLLEETVPALADVERPELLHGDLWSGNTFTSGGGAPVLIDPAVYHGDGEVDLAMSELFGGFDPTFYHTYDTVRPISAGYRAFKRDLYQLYYLLVHVNIFGASYERGALEAAARVLRSIG